MSVSDAMDLRPGASSASGCDALRGGRESFVGEAIPSPAPASLPEPFPASLCFPFAVLDTPSVENGDVGDHDHDCESSDGRDIVSSRGEMALDDADPLGGSDSTDSSTAQGSSRSTGMHSSPAAPVFSGMWMSLSCICLSSDELE